MRRKGGDGGGGQREGVSQEREGWLVRKRNVVTRARRGDRSEMQMEEVGKW